MANVNIEKVIIAWLSANVGSGWLVFGDQPSPRPEKYLTVDRTGGPRESMVLDKAEILIEVYHKTSRVDASDKAYELADILPNLTTLEPITRSKVNSVVKLDDLVGQYWRYQIYVDIYARRAVLDADLEYPAVEGDVYDKTYSMDFVNQTSVTVNHNLNKYPSVQVYDQDGNGVECSVVFNSLNTITLTFNSPVTGTVYCN